MAFAIDVRDIHKTFKGGVRALAGVSFAVEEGTIFGLLGPNGAGKTTVVRVLTTTLRSDSGTASVLGHDVDREAALVRTLIGLAGQFAAVDENLTGRENLRMVGHLNHLPSAQVLTRADELLEMFGLLDSMNRPAKTYSGGMRRRLDVAAALVARPPVLFLDEPTTGLDPQSRIDLWGVIEGLVDRGTTVLLTTQYLEEADRLANSIAVVDHGLVISQGTPSELKSDLGATVLDIGFRDEALAAAAAGLLAGVGAKPPHVVGSAVEITVDEGPKSAMEALRRLDQAGLETLTLTLREPSLDDVFLSLTGRPAEDRTADEPAPGRASRRGRSGRSRRTGRSGPSTLPSPSSPSSPTGASSTSTPSTPSTPSTQSTPSGRPSSDQPGAAEPTSSAAQPADAEPASTASQLGDHTGAPR